MNILITGVSGFIGKKLSKSLLDEGHKIWGIDNFYNSTKADVPEGVDFLESDVAQDEWRLWLSGIKINKIIHLAAQSSGEVSFSEPIYDLDTNIKGTMQVCLYSRDNDVSQIIFASSMSVYGESQGLVNESTLAIPLSLYAVGKKASEDYLRIFSKQFGFSVKSLRLFNIYGDGQNLYNMSQGMVSIFLAQLLDSSKAVVVKGGIERYRDFSYISDIVSVFLSIVDESLTISEFDILNVGSGEKTTVLKLINSLKSTFNIEKPIKVVESTIGDQMGIIADNSYLQKRYPTTFLKVESGLRLWRDSFEN